MARRRRGKHAALVALATIALVSSASAHAPRGHSRARARHPMLSTLTSKLRVPPRLVFGIYPGGGAGTVGPSGTTKPEDPVRRLAALEQLRAPGQPFVVRLYASYTGQGGASAQQQVGGDITDYGSAGFQTELVLCYRPADGGSAADVRGFSGFVQDTLKSLGTQPGFVSLQVTNEANVGGAPNASDGYYLRAKDALIQGVIAAKAEIRSSGLRQVKVGFNWAYATDSAEPAFWRYLGHNGGRRFVAALDWVGLDAYPGTWGPALPPGDLVTATQSFMEGALGRLRSTYMPLAGIPPTVPLRIAENGFPTGPGRTEAMQATVMKAAVTAAYQARLTDNITGYRWFDLRDADSSSSSFESQYGLMRDDYSAKPAFGVYAALVARLSR